MSTWGFTKGAKVKIENREFALVRDLGKGEWQLEAADSGELRRMHQANMLTEFAEGRMVFLGDDELAPRDGAEFRRQHAVKQFDLLGDESKRIAKQRRKIVVAIIKEFGGAWNPNKIRQRVAILWQAIGGSDPAPHPTTVWRWIKRYIASGSDIRSLVDRFKCCGNRVSRFTAQVEEIVRLAVDKIYLTEERGTYQDVLDYATTEVDRENRLRLESERLALPSLLIVKRLVAEIPEYDRYVARYGRPAADIRFRHVLGKAFAGRPLERVEIDHTRIDVFVVDEETGLPLGRPWLTLCIDVRTRVIVGFHLGFDPPSFLTVSRALRHSILPKVKLSETYKAVKNAWDAYGIMDGIVVDNGPEFHSESLEATCYSLGIDIQYCPRKAPWFKAVVERTIGTLNRGVAHGVPGTVFSNLVEKADYDAARKATITLSTLRAMIHVWIVDYYHQRPHKGLGDTPAHAWQVETTGMAIRLPARVDDLEASLGKIDSRRLTHKGIEINGLFYNSREAGALTARLGIELTVTVRYDDEDLGHIHILIPDTEEYLAIPAIDVDYAEGLTLWQHKVCKRFAARELEGRTDKIALAEAKRRIIELVEADMLLKRKRSHVKSQRFLGKGTRGTGASHTVCDAVSAAPNPDVAKPAAMPVPLLPAPVEMPVPISTKPPPLPSSAPRRVERLTAMYFDVQP